MTASAIGNSSGSIAMPSAIPASMPCIQSPRDSPYHAARRVETTNAAIANARTRRRSCPASGVGERSMLASDAPIRPT